uniref:Pre-mRNA-splicing factor SLU7 n=1 Tax=Lactuca sativa TaxID=4236 RepID=A0A9R1XUI8_LACSA|nr:hypothetical protein LSAT_V11C100048120 [Lactuca sativa]
MGDVLIGDTTTGFCSDGCVTIADSRTSLLAGIMEAFEMGNDVHMQAAPSQAELLYKNYKVNKEKLESQVKEKLNMIVLEESSKARKTLLPTKTLNLAKSMKTSSNQVSFHCRKN